jgi:glycosyltransferase involved in cell wall biosynthesis
VSQSVLYISYDGMLEPLGQSQVLAYLEKLAPGWRIHLISFEKAADWRDQAQVKAMRQRIADAGIKWHPRIFRNRPRPLAAVFNIFGGAFAALAIAKRHRVRIFHARNILCSTMCIPALTMSGGDLISDIRGFWPDERVDAGHIRKGGAVHRVLKRLECLALRKSAWIVTLTQRSVPILKEDPQFGNPTAPISVIPTCVDTLRFRVAARAQGRPLMIGYVGSFGTWYMLDETIAVCAAVLKLEPSARFLIVNRHERASICRTLARHSIADSAFEIRSAAYSEMPDLIGRMSFGMCLVRPQFSKLSSAPTKFAEYLACGVPVLAADGVGDLGQIIRDERVGIAANEFGEAALADLASRIVNLAKDLDIHRRCRAVAEEKFSLERGVEEYRRIYDGLARREDH